MGIHRLQTVGYYCCLEVGLGEQVRPAISRIYIQDGGALSRIGSYKNGQEEKSIR